jgi:hypothetical protein
MQCTKSFLFGQRCSFQNQFFSFINLDEFPSSLLLLVWLFKAVFHCSHLMGGGVKLNLKWEKWPQPVNTKYTVKRKKVLAPAQRPQWTVLLGCIRNWPWTWLSVLSSTSLQGSRDSTVCSVVIFSHGRAVERVAGLSESPGCQGHCCSPSCLPSVFSSKDVRLPAGLQHSLAVEAEAQRQAKVRVSQDWDSILPRGLPLRSTREYTGRPLTDSIPLASSPSIHPGAGWQQAVSPLFC